MYLPTEFPNWAKLRHHMSHVPLRFEDLRDQRIKPCPAADHYPADEGFPFHRSDE